MTITEERPRAPVALTVREVAHALRVQDAKVRGLIRSGELRASRVGWEWRVTPRAVSEYLDATEDTAARRRTPRPGAACGGRPRTP
ncbi:MAG: helix-turn-helix domain-containing protein [Planctomycetes bacterium]|nr:helix-turn-helix domain-containing protein [Planctomycetota bacterium]